VALFNIGKFLRRAIDGGSAANGTRSYHAVSIVPGAKPCRTALKWQGHRFLSDEAPRLPLASCNSPTCTCAYKHHVDRRAGPRRSADFFVTSKQWSGNERRRAGGRRKTDS